MCVCVYACMHVCMYVCMYVCMHYVFTLLSFNATLLHYLYIANRFEVRHTANPSNM